MTTAVRRKGRNAYHLTPVEASVWELHLAGKKPKEIGEALGMKATSVSRRLIDARQKVEAAAYV